jgi:thioredoxin 1
LKMVGKMLIEVTEQNFDEEVLNSDLPVFACFTTSWCRACFPTCLVADELVNRYEGRIKFVRIDREKVLEISDEYHITVVPSIIFFQDSQMIKKLVGYQEERALRDLLDNLLVGAEAPINVSEEYDEEA